MRRYSHLAIMIFFMSTLLSGAVYLDQMNPDHPLDKKILDLVKRIESDPENPILHNDLGVKLRERRFPKDAMREFKSALEIDETFYPAWYNLGLYYLENGNRYRAMRALKKTLKYKRGHDLAEYHLGDVFYQWGMTKRAIRHYAKAFKINRHIFDLTYNPSVINNDILPRVMDYYYKKYRGSSLAPYQMTPPLAKKQYRDKLAKIEEEKKKADDAVGPAAVQEPVKEEPQKVNRRDVKRTSPAKSGKDLTTTPPPVKQEKP